MSKSSKPGAKSGKSGPTEKDRAPYLALVTCDAFSSDSAFSADVLGVPALLPVVGRPAIAYCLEWLANSAVEEVVVAAGDGADEVQNWFRQSKYASLAAPKFSFLALPTIANLGDALREVDQMEIFRGEDILLVRGPLVASLALDPVELIERHRKRKTADQTIIMSSLYAPQPASPASLVLSPSRKLIHLQSHGPLRISLDLLAERGAPNGFQVLSGHAPSGIEVVSMHVPALFTENFDHEKLYEDLVPEVLDSEVLNHAFYVDVTKSGEFVKRIDSTSGLLEVSLDVLARKSYPLVPDVDWLGSGEVSQFDAKSGCYGPNPTSSTTVSMIPAPPPATSTISHSIVSPHAHISAHSRISRSLILPNARIGANCTLDTCIIGPNAVVEDGTTLERGCVIGAGARVGPGTIESGSLILTRDDDEDEEEEEDSGKLGRIGTRPETPVDETSDEEGDESSDEELDLNKLVGKSSKLTSAQIATARSELKQTLIRAIAESHSINDCFAEIKTTKMAENASWTDVRLIVCRELVELGVKQGWKAAAKWGGLVALCIMDRTKAADGKEVVEFFADASASHPAATTAKLLVPLLKQLYDSDVLEEEHIVSWFAGYPGQRATDTYGNEVGDAHEKVKKGVEPLVRWLQEAEEESSEEDSE